MYIMKIGLITFHRAHNYGAVLQCYALCKTLSSLGHDIEVIDYYPTYFREQYISISKRNMHGMSFRGKIAYLINQLLTCRTRKKRSIGFDNFIGNLPLSPLMYTENSIMFNKYDAIIFGSDQIWNPILTFGEDNIYSGNFNVRGAKRIAYAASTSPQICINKYKGYFRGIIERFNTISVREGSLNDYINGIQPGTSRVVLDPVLLLDRESWYKIAVKPSVQNYLLIYTVPQNPKVWELASMIASYKGLQIVEIRPNVSRKSRQNVYQHVSPEEFLGYFQHASYIVTTSFHGTAFALKFNKQFVTLKFGSAVDDRAANLLNITGLSERMIAYNALHIPTEDIIYDDVNKILQGQIVSSLSFIENSL